MSEKVIIMGAAGRDFHNFLTVFRDDPRYEVVGFTATQIPAIAGRIFPPQLAGPRYPSGIPIFPEEQLEERIERLGVDLVVFSYSDVTHIEVMHRASLVAAKGANFLLLGGRDTMIHSRRPVVAVCGVRTGCGKSPTTRKICAILKQRGANVVVVRHPMPYGNLTEQVVQRFASEQDFRTCNCTIEELEEYQPLVDLGIVVYAGVDYRRILEAAEKEADMIVWDGGNNDTPFYRPDIHIVVFDPLRAGHELTYHPGETNMRMADICVINKIDSATPEQVQQVEDNIKQYAPEADIVRAESRLLVNDPERIRGKRVLVVEDGPTLTHGEMAHGAGLLAAEKYGAAAIVDPRPYALPSIAAAFRRYPHIGMVLPAMGYGHDQILELQETINRCECDLVVFATPIHLARLLNIRHPTIRIRYEYRDHGEPCLEDVLVERLENPKTDDRRRMTEME